MQEKLRSEKWHENSEQGIGGEGFYEKLVKNFDKNNLDFIKNASFQHYNSWRIVLKEDSISTLVRMEVKVVIYPNFTINCVWIYLRFLTLYSCFMNPWILILNPSCG